MTDEQEMKTLLREFFKILNRQEESDSGTMFHPTFISCCRVMEHAKLEKILPRLEELSKKE